MAQNGNFWIFGGLSLSGEVLGDHWEFNTSDLSWEHITYISTDHVKLGEEITP